MTRVASLPAALLIAVFALAGCSNDETGPVEDHTPANAELLVEGVEVTSLVLPAGGTVRVEVRFVDSTGQEITGIEDTHHTSLTFSPEGLATTESVEGFNFQKDVTAGATPLAGEVMVGYGHDEAADELEFGPFNVIVTGGGGEL